jgi:hypothetical protein
MDDRARERPDSKGTASVWRASATRLREGVEASSRGLSRRVSELGDRMKHSRAIGRIGSAVEPLRVLKKATDAQRRGNHAMAYRLLEPMVRAQPDDPRLVAALWRAALACDRIEEVAPSMSHVIQRLAGSGRAKRASELWVALDGAAPVDPGALVRIAEVLEIGDLRIRALREAAACESRHLSPGLAAHTAELAREIDPPTALRAVRRALEAPGLHDTKRRRLHQLEGELLEAGASETDPVQAAAGEALAAVEPVARYQDLKLVEAMPTGFLPEAMTMQLAAARAARVEYAKVEAIAVAEVRGLARQPVLVIDLLLNWCSTQDTTLRAVRLRGDGFDPRMVFETAEDRAEASRAFVAELLERCEAAALPSRDERGDVVVRSFESLEAYARNVLRVAC